MRILVQLVIFVTLVVLGRVLEPPVPEAHPALEVNASKIEGFTVTWEGKSATYRRRGERFLLDEPEATPAPGPTPDPGAPTFDGLTSTVSADERRLMRMDRLTGNLLASLTGARLVDLGNRAPDEAVTGLAAPTGMIRLHPGDLALEVGAETPSRTGHYARSGDRIMVVPVTTVSTLKQLARAQFPRPQF